jgi:hypothetical protein
VRLPKEYLSSAEIKQLASTPYDNNPDVYRAGMFSIYTPSTASGTLILKKNGGNFSLLPIIQFIYKELL